MLAFFTRPRLPQSCALVLEQPTLVELIFTYLDVADLCLVAQVCVLWRSVVFSDPYRENRVLHYQLTFAAQGLKVTLSQAYQQRCGPLRQETEAPYKSLAMSIRRLPYHSKRFSPKTPPTSQVEIAFKSFAKAQGILPRRRSEFSSDQEFIAFAVSVQACYNRFSLYHNTSIARYEAEIQREKRAGDRGMLRVVREWIQYE